MDNLFLYLLKVAACQMVFCLLYLAILRNLSYFQLNRIYLLTATLISFVIPFISIPIWDTASTVPSLYFLTNLQELSPSISTQPGIKLERDFSTTEWLLLVIAICYFTGLCVRFFKLSSGIAKLFKLVHRSEIKEYEGVKAVHVSKGPLFFAFLNYVFINIEKLNLSNNEFQQVLSHEKSHIMQKHTLDNLFMELALVFCWFNPFLRIMKKELNNVHEFYADQQASGHINNVDQYSSLILKLSADQSDCKPYLSHQFSMINIKQRIIMLNKQKKPNYIVLRYFTIVPCLALLLVMFSFTKKLPPNTVDLSEYELSQTIGTITWKGNTLYSDSYLTEFLGLNLGDKFNEEEINQKLIYQPDGKDLASLYMDKGYLFFTVNIEKNVNEDKVDLTFDINEGQVMKIGKVTVKGNNEVATERILKMIELKPGDLFSRSKLISSQRNIIASGSFEPIKVIPTPFPNPEEGTVNIEFEVAEY